jgi:hypothetical protein
VARSYQLQADHFEQAARAATSPQVREAALAQSRSFSTLAASEQWVMEK